MSTWSGEGLTMPDLRPHFRHLNWRVMPHSMGVEVASDWSDKADDDPVFGLYKNCGLWAMAEAAILYNVAKARGGDWCDIGSHTGWTTAHILAGSGEQVVCVDPMYRDEDFKDRAKENLLSVCPPRQGAGLYGNTSEEWFGVSGHVPLAGYCIDGDHEPGKPLEDAINASNHLAETGVIMLHDGVGRPVREAVEWLMDHGFKARAYFTPHLVFACWRGDFTPPDHTPDPIVRNAHLDGRYEDFDFRRCI